MRYLFVLGLILLTTGCSTNPMTGRSQLLLVSEKSAISQSYSAYSKMVGDLSGKGKILYDETINHRVMDITDRLITQAVRYRADVTKWDWSVTVIDEPNTINAFCMSGGKMAVFTGLLHKVSPTDDELAQVMGHEIGHALANHTAEKMSTKIMADLAVAVIAAAGRTASDQQQRKDAASLGALAFINLPNSREAETEADKIGVELAARAGYDPHAGESLWKKMMQASRESPSRVDFLSTHPASVKRIETLNSLIPAMEPIFEASRENRYTRPVAWTSGEKAGVFASVGVRDVTPGQEQKEPAKAPVDAGKLMFYSSDLAEFETGKTRLECESCSLKFMWKQGALKTALENSDWRTLFRETLATGYKFDLAYYYLAKAAEGLGFSDAAAIYHDKAYELSKTEEYACSKARVITCKDIEIKPYSGNAAADMEQIKADAASKASASDRKQ